MMRNPIDAHRAPDPSPVEDPPTDPFEPADPHQPPIRTPMNDDPLPDPNPSIVTGYVNLARRVTLH